MQIPIHYLHFFIATIFLPSNVFLGSAFKINVKPLLAIHKMAMQKLIITLNLAHKKNRLKLNG